VALQRVRLVVHVLDRDARLREILREVLRHALGEGRDEDAFVAVDSLVDAVHEVLDLPRRVGHLDGGVDQIRGANDLFDDLVRLPAFVVARRRRDVEGPVRLRLELLEREGTVVVGGREPEPVLDQRILTRLVALVLALDLREGLVGLVDDREEVVGEVVQQGVGSFAGRPVREVDGVVLDARTVARLA